jgi:phosphoribosyl 1,2-cyclic phosphodiesterase
VHTFRSCDKISITVVLVHATPPPHDGGHGSAFVVEAGNKRLGVLTDLGHVFKDLVHIVASLDAVFLESNYDPDMLAAGPYPAYLKQRISRRHLSNSKLLSFCAPPSQSVSMACLAHLSGENNHPDVALKTHREAAIGDIVLHVAGRYQATDILTVA